MHIKIFRARQPTYVQVIYLLNCCRLSINTIILCFPCNMPKYFPRFEGIMHDPKGSALCLITFGHILAYYTGYTILLLLLGWIFSSLSIKVRKSRPLILHDFSKTAVYRHMTWTSVYYAFAYYINTNCPL